MSKSHTTRRLSKLLAGCRERAYRDEWTGWADDDTELHERRLLHLALTSNLLDEVLFSANAQIEVGQLFLI